MKSELMDEIKTLRGKGYTVNDVARLTGTTPAQVKYVMRSYKRTNQKVDENTIIDGERLEDRVNRLKRELKYYIALPEGLD